MNILEQTTPTSLEVSFIETLIFYTCLDSYSEAIDSNGYVFQKTKDGTKFIHDVVEILWKIASQDDCFNQRLSRYEDLLKRSKNVDNKALTILRDRQVNNFRTVKPPHRGGDNYPS